MSPERSSPREFRQRLLGKEHVLGTFLKIPTSHATELLGLVGFDFAIVDQEHAPLDRATIDLLCLAARAAGIATIVRVDEPTPAAILSALDVGATGVMVPHVDSPAKAEAVAAACRHRGGKRGYSSTTRAGDFGGIAQDAHIARQDAEVTCVAMIEDLAALAHIEAIAAVPGIDAFFIGRGDLSAANGQEKMKEAVQQITAVGRRVGKTLMALVSSRDDARAMRDAGVSAFAFSNDVNLLKAAAAQAHRDYGDPTAW